MAEISSLLGLITDDNTRQALIAQMENMFDNAPDEERLIQEIGNPTKAAAALVDAGLWVETGDGWRIRSFLKWNLSQAEQAEERERKQAAAILGNHKRHHKTERSADCIHCQEAMK